MSRMLDPPLRNPFHGPSVGDLSAKARTIPLLSSTAPTNDSISPGDPMDMSPSASTSTSMAPPLQNGPEGDNGNANANHTNHTNGTGMDSMQSQTANSNHPIGAAAAGQQPKVVQTAFIHKLYSMLQDPSIQHLISWSSSNESFVMSPSSDFSKVLSQYFKHTNISSFVRQLNMYGFHKVSDVFHTGSPDSPMWEFRHGNGSFRKGDVAGLRDIKRRASRHALIHRDSFSTHKPNPSQPGTPAEPTVDGQDPRMANLEQSLYDMHNRLSRMEDQNALLSSHCHVLTEGLARCHQWTSSMSSFIVSLVPDTENSIHRDAANMQREITRQLDYIRTLENPQDAMVSGRQPYFPSMPLDPGPPPLSPRQSCQDDGRRPSGIRHPLPPHITISPHRHGSIGGANPTPVYNKPPIPQQSSLHPLASVSSPPGPNLARRHTSADIRQHGWPPAGPSPNPQYGPATQWPSSPSRNPGSSDQHVRDALAQYQIGGSRRQQEAPRQTSPPIHLDPSQPDIGWSTGGPKFPRPVESLPGTRRSSMASNVHSLLNPSSAAERIEENDGPLGEDRKRKRLQ